MMRISGTIKICSWQRWQIFHYCDKKFYICRHEQIIKWQKFAYLRPVTRRVACCNFRHRNLVRIWVIVDPFLADFGPFCQALGDFGVTFNDFWAILASFFQFWVILAFYSTTSLFQFPYFGIIIPRVQLFRRCIWICSNTQTQFLQWLRKISFLFLIQSINFCWLILSQAKISQ